MKNPPNLIIIFLALLLSGVLPSCSSGYDVVGERSIQKRKYRKGYHVDYKSAAKSRSSVQPIEKLAPEPATPLNFPPKAVQKAKPSKKGPLAKLPKAKTKKNIEKAPFKRQLDIVLDKVASLPISKTPVSKRRSVQQQDPNETRHVEGFGMASFILALLMVSVMISPIVWFSILFALLAFIFSLISLSRHKANPGKFKAKWAAIVGLVLSSVYFLLVILVIFALLILVGNGSI